MIATKLAKYYVLTLANMCYSVNAVISGAEGQEIIITRNGAAVKKLMQIVDVIPALKNDIKAALGIMTRNVKDYVKSPVPAILPDDLLKIL